MLSCRFSKPPRSIALVGQEPVRLLREAELEAVRQEAYQRGYCDAVETEIQEHAAQHAQAMAGLERICGAFASQNEAIAVQFCQMLPEMVMTGLRRVLATIEIDEKTVRNIVSEMIAEVHASTPGLEVVLSERDFALLEGKESSFGQKHPGICFVADSDLHPGDCLVRSRFGTLDGRLATKIDNVEGLLQ